LNSLSLFIESFGDEMPSVTVDATQVIDDQKAKRAEYAGEMRRTLAMHESTGFHFRFTDDESWMFYSYHERTM
jgi:hypothetical protein